MLSALRIRRFAIHNVITLFANVIHQTLRPPLSIITERLKTVTITVPIANYDNNQHAENENIRLQNLWNGIETWAAVMTMK